MKLNNETEILLEISLSVGNSMDLGEMLGESLSTIMRLLNISGAQVIRAVVQNDGHHLQWAPVITIPRPLIRNQDHTEFLETARLPDTTSLWQEWTKLLPLTTQKDSKTRYLFNLPGFGALAMEMKSGTTDTSFIRSLQPVLNKLGNAAMACLEGKEKKEKEILLHNQQQRLSSIIKGTNSGTWEWNIQTGETVFNERWAEIIGYTLEEISPVSINTWKKFAHPDDLIKSEELLNKHFSGKLDYYECESRMHHKNGEWIWVLDRGKVAQWTEDGKPLLMMGTHQDITESKQVELELRESEERAALQRTAISELVLSQVLAERDISTSLQRINEFIATTLGVARASVWTLSMDGLKLHCTSLFETNSRTHSSGASLNTTDLTRYLQKIITDNSNCVEDAQNDPRTSELTAPYLSRLGITSMMDAGVFMDGKLVGIVCCEHIGPKRKWYPDEESFILTAAAIVAQLFLNAERNQAEEKLKASEEKLLEILNNINDSVWSVSWPQTDKLIFISPSVLKLYGHTQKDFEENPDLWLEAVHPDDRFIAKSIRKDLTVDGSSDVEYRIIHANGAVRLLHSRCSLILDAQENPIRVDGIISDITEQKAYQEMLQLLINMAKTFINMPAENLSDEINRTLKVMCRFVNADRAYIFDYDWEKRTSSNTYEWCEEGIESQIGNLQNSPNDAIPWWITAHKKGNTLSVPDISALPDDDGVKQILAPQGIKSLMTLPMMIRGVCVGFIGFDSVSEHHRYTEKEETLLSVFSEILVNVLNRASLEKSLVQEKEKAITANKAKSEFLANMSHEIRTPMNAILGFSEALYYKLNSENHKKMVKSVLSSGNLLLSLLNDILDLSKIESGKLEILPHPASVKNIIEEIVLLFNNKALKKGIELSMQIAPDFPDILIVDEIRIKQIIFNLTGNAVKFTHKGFVHIKACYKPVSSKKGDLIIEIEDTGIGIANSDQELIFETFRQQSGQSNRLFEGTGLGLAITKRLVKKMDGTIDLKSTLNKGSVFTIKISNIEVSNANVRENIPQRAMDYVLFSKAFVLVVDDVISNIETIENLLLPVGLSVSSAYNGEIALELLNHTIPDLILLDLRMPGIDGFEVANRIKADPKTANIPVIAYTASVFQSGRIEKSGDFDGALYKPITRNELLSTLAKFLEHTILPQNIKHSDDVFRLEADDLSKELMQHLPEIIGELKNSFLPIWESIHKKLVLYRIEAFASELGSFAKKYQFNLLISYSNQLSESLEFVQLEAISKTLEEFPDIIKRMEALIK